MAADCLAVYAGDTLLYAGEGRGGVNADEAFFDRLAAETPAAPAVEDDTLRWTCPTASFHIHASPSDGKKRRKRNT